MKDGPIDHLMKAMAGLPGMGPRSARRIALHLLTNKEAKMKPLIDALSNSMENVRSCETCGNLDSVAPCRLCQDGQRHQDVICVVAGVADLWAIERTGIYKGQYHVLGGLLSALDGVSPSELTCDDLFKRIQEDDFSEVILALSATVDGQSTAHYLSDKIAAISGSVKISRLAHGVPVGGELDYLDDGTISTAMKSRANVG